MKKIFNAAAVLILALALSACGNKSAKNEQTAEKPALTVGVIEVKPCDMEDYIEFGGTVSAADSVAVLPGVAGKIAEILVELGDKVTRNQVIARVDPSKPGADFAFSPIKASVSGTVTAVLPSVGAYVTTSSTVAEIASTDRLEIKVNVSERFVPLVRQNQIAGVTFKAFPKEAFEASVAKISPVLDPDTRTMQVTLKLSDSHGLIKSGMFAHVKLTTEQKENVLAVPNRAILQNMGKLFVYIVREAGGKSSAVRADIQRGLSVDGMTEVTAGLSSGDKIVVKGQNMLSDGQLVKAVSAE